MTQFKPKPAFLVIWVYNNTVVAWLSELLLSIVEISYFSILFSLKKMLEAFV